MSKSLVEVLTDARALITPPENWSGPREHVHNQRCYCAATAIWQAAADESGATSSIESVSAGDALAKVAGVRLPSESYLETGNWRSIYDWNDHTTHDVVLATFDKAIEAARD